MPEIWNHIVNDMGTLFSGSPTAWWAFGQVLLIDIVLAGDNAIVIGALAAGLPAEQRKKVILIGIIAALVLRIGFALVVTQLLQVVGLIFAGGLLLLYGFGTIIGPTVGGPVMSAFGPYALFTVPALAHLLITAYAILRSRRRAPVPASDRDAFITTGPLTTPESLTLSPRAAPLPEGDSPEEQYPGAAI